MVLSGEHSSALFVLSGMLQGSAYLALYYSNEVTHQISPGSIMSLFADYIALCRPVSSIEDYIIILQNDATAIVNWVVNSLLSLQPAECCYYYGHIEKTQSETSPTSHDLN